MSIPSDNPILLARDFGPDEVCLAVGEGEIVALNAACDEAFLRALSGADPAWPGGLWLKGEALHTLRPAARMRFAHAQCAVAPRVGKLLPELTVAENTALPLLLTGLGRQEARRRALRWLERLDVIHCADLRIVDLTPAEMRLVALARALVLDPAVLLAEDPTAGLGGAEKVHLLRILRAACGTHGLTIVVASDDADVVEWADRRVVVRVGGTGTPSDAGSMSDAAGADGSLRTGIAVGAGISISAAGAGNKFSAAGAGGAIGAVGAVGAVRAVGGTGAGNSVAADSSAGAVSAGSSVGAGSAAAAVATTAAFAEPATATPEPVAEPFSLFGHTARGLPHRIARHARGEHRFTPVGSGSERGR
ncbi:MAG: ATP-binding cassette domain-containing protein [Catenulispora sp.]|nr:ATP-binding cassette domain-containing protein [Catenulispora sp.]